MDSITFVAIAEVVHTTSELNYLTCRVIKTFCQGALEKEFNEKDVIIRRKEYKFNFLVLDIKVLN